MCVCTGAWVCCASGSSQPTSPGNWTPRVRAACRAVYPRVCLAFQTFVVSTLHQLLFWGGATGEGRGGDRGPRTLCISWSPPSGGATLNLGDCSSSSGGEKFAAECFILLCMFVLSMLRVRCSSVNVKKKQNANQFFAESVASTEEAFMLAAHMLTVELLYFTSFPAALQIHSKRQHPPVSKFSFKLRKNWFTDETRCGLDGWVQSWGASVTSPSLYEVAIATSESSNSFFFREITDL